MTYLSDTRHWTSTLCKNEGGKIGGITWKPSNKKAVVYSLAEFQTWPTWRKVIFWGSSILKLCTFLGQAEVTMDHQLWSFYLSFFLSFYLSILLQYLPVHPLYRFITKIVLIVSIAFHKTNTFRPSHPKKTPVAIGLWDLGSQLFKTSTTSRVGVSQIQHPKRHAIHLNSGGSGYGCNRLLIG